MRKTAIALIAALSAIAPIHSANAHQPVALLSTDTTAQKGPLLTDGTVSFAIRASFAKAGESRGFRAAFTSGDTVAVQYLIVDKRPENRLKNTQLPTLVMTTPSGKKVTLRFTERTPFYEPFGKTNYLYLARYSARAEEGIYSFIATSRAKADITIAVGDKEVPGEVVRGALAPKASSSPSSTNKVVPTPTPTPTPSATPTATRNTPARYTIDQVRQNNSAARCWTVIRDNVYDLTAWISAHPGGSTAIRSLCGTDGTSSFTSMHGNQGRPERTLDSYLLGPLAK